MSSSDFSITNEQRKQIDAALLSFSAKDIKKGQGLFRRGDVSDLSWDDAGEKISTQVYGGSLYSIEVLFQKNQLLLNCNCPVRGLCKHLAATLLKAREVSVAEEAPVMEIGSDTLYGALAHKLPAKLPRAVQRFFRDAEKWWAKKLSRINLSDLKNAGLPDLLRSLVEATAADRG
jgi:uncharacterized Zn finger protein